VWIDGCNVAKNNRIAMEHLEAGDLLRERSRDVAADASQNLQ
jgi:hypothetical protein